MLFPTISVAAVTLVLRLGRYWNGHLESALPTSPTRICLTPPKCHDTICRLATSTYAPARILPQDYLASHSPCHRDWCAVLPPWTEPARANVRVSRKD